MADVADIAADIEQERLSVILRNRKPMSTQPSALYCDECDRDIPEVRRRALPGVRTCVDCQTLIEFKQRLH